LSAQKVLTDNSWGPAGDAFYEFQKEHQTIQKLKKQVAELTMDLQKVNAQLELSKSLSHVA
jgi:t-SNARE complex subunit (syntaxin)